MIGSGVCRRAVVAASLFVVIALSGSVAAEADSPITGESVQGLIADGRYADAAGAARQLLAAASAAHGTRSLEAARACDLLVGAMWRGGRAGSPEALEVAERAQSIKQDILGPRGLELADTLVEKARVLEYVGRLDDAYASLRLTVEIHGASETVDTVQGFRALTELGRMLRVMGRYREAADELDRAAGRAEKIFGPTHAVTATALIEKGMLFMDTARYREARRLFEEALEIRESLLPPDHPELAAILNDLAWACRSLDDLDPTQAYLERALRIRDRSLRPDHPLIAQTLEALGLLYWYAGRGPPMKAFERAHPIIERAVADGYWEAGVWLVHEGIVVWNERQDRLTATRYYETALDLFERTLGPGHPRVYWALGSVCGAYWDTGRHEESTACSERRREVLQACLARGDSPKLEADALDIEAGRFEKAEKIREARDSLRDALKIREEIYGPYNNLVGWTRFHVARTSQMLGEYDESRRMYELARQSWEGAGLWAKQPYEPILLGLSWLHEDLGEYEEARRLRRAAIESQPTLQDEVPHPGVGPRLVDYSRFLMRAGNPDEALTAALDAERVIRPHLRLTIPGLSEREGLRYAATWASGLDVALSVAASTGEPAVAGAAFEALVRARALVLDEIASRQQLAWGAGDPEVAELAEQLKTVRRRLADQLVRGPGDDDAATHMRAIDGTRTEKEAMERRLFRLSLSFRRNHSADAVDLAAIQHALTDRDALVSFARFMRLQPRTESGPDSVPTTQEEYLAFIVRPGRCEVVPLGPASTIDDLIDQLRSRLASAALYGGPGRAEGAYRSAARQLRALVWDPIAPSLEGSRRVFVVPDGELNLVHLAALPAEGSGYLAEHGPPIHYLAAERDLVDPEWPSNGSGVLALGAPAFDDPLQFAQLRRAGDEQSLDERLLLASRETFRGTRSACGDFQTIRFEPLSAAALEVEELAGLWRSDAMSSSRDSEAADSGSADVVLTGSEASETAFKLLAPGHRVLHAATHGFFLGEACPSALDRPAGFGLDGLPADVVGENPLLLSGLAFAGANLREHAGPDEEDGILTAEEIASLDLSSVEWAVLSACDTGVGEVRAGEGVFGLRRAFQVAGARTLIMSLWPVEDEVTRAWMQELYTNRFVKGMTTIDSVHQASLALLTQRREAGLSTHPFYWAGFIASGDWR
jgi:CHAT domain-containing protein/tetratricopeptide (TPR) repeat protein